MAVHSRLVMDVQHASNRNGDNIHQWNYFGGLHQKYRFYRYRNGYYKIVVAKSRKCMDVSGNRKNNGANIFQVF